MTQNWENYRYFIYLARHPSLTEAAEVMGVSHTTVYRRIKAFQEELGIKLFEVASNRYRLTPVGHQLIKKLSNVEQELGQISRELEGLDTRISGRVVIASTDSFGFTLLPKIIRGLHQTYPDLTVVIKAGGEILSMSQREADIAIRVTNEPPEGLIGRKVGPVTMGVFASRSYLERNPYRESHGLEGHDFIQLEQKNQAVNARRWIDRQGIPEREKKLKVFSMLNLAQYCHEGLGVAVLPKFLSRYFKGLVLLSTPKDLPSNDLWILYHRDLMKNARVRVTADVLYHQLKPFF